jgi:hypothetical protein
LIDISILSKKTEATKASKPFLYTRCSLELSFCQVEYQKTFKKIALLDKLEKKKGNVLKLLNIQNRSVLPSIIFITTIDPILNNFKYIS